VIILSIHCELQLIVTNPVGAIEIGYEVCGVTTTFGLVLGVPADPAFPELAVPAFPG
jgi:hypothetical protein